jgi:protein-disulfide isomerase
MSAAITGRCVLQQSSDAFWKYHDSVYDNQDVTSPENAYNKLLEFAVQAGSTEDKLKPCIADPKTQDLMRHNMAEGAMDVTSTPTSFVVLLEDYLVRADHSAVCGHSPMHSAHSAP